MQFRLTNINVVCQAYQNIKRFVRFRCNKERCVHCRSMDLILY